VEDKYHPRPQPIAINATDSCNQVKIVR